MPSIGILLTVGTLLLTAYLFCFNDKFRSAMKCCCLVFGSGILYLTVAAPAGIDFASQVLPVAIAENLQMPLLIALTVIQWLALIWITIRPRVDWHMPRKRLGSASGNASAIQAQVQKKFGYLIDPTTEVPLDLQREIRMRKGILLHGVSGVDSPTLARILANMSGAPVAICETSSMQSRFLAVLPYMIALYRKLNKMARRHGAALVVFTNIDTIGMSRRSPSNGERRWLRFFGSDSGDVLSALLACLDGMFSTDPLYRRVLRRFNLAKGKLPPATVITIGTTARPARTLDPALTRPGRLEQYIELTVTGCHRRNAA